MKTTLFATTVAAALAQSAAFAADSATTGSAESHPAPAAKSARPNIIVILADDLSYGDLSCFGQKQFSTPNIDRLAAEGRVFANAYAGAPWCAPSRTALLTGRNGAHFAPIKTDGRVNVYNPTVASLLKNAGYATGIVGKWHMCEPNQESTNASKAAPWKRGFDSCCVMMFGKNYHFPDQLERDEKTSLRLPENNGMDAYVLKNAYNANQAGRMYNAQGWLLDSHGKIAKDLSYAEDIYRREALAFLRAHKSEPFFLYYATPLVHGPLVVKALDEFKDKPKWSIGQKLWATMVRELDNSVGLLLDEVKRLGIENNTIILFASDNGYAQWGYLGRKPWLDDPLFKNKGPWNRGKFITTNGGVMVPFIAWGPGRVPVGKTGRAINFYDFMATAGDLAKTKLPCPTDGVSFLPLLEGRDRDQPVRESMVWPHTTCLGDRGMTDDWVATAKKPKVNPPDAVLLDEKWYAMAFQEQPKPAAAVIRLFDIATDPGMKHDLSAEHPELCARAAATFQNLEKTKNSKHEQ